MAVMIVALLGTSAVQKQLLQWQDAQRDSAVIGLLGGIPLSRTHRWQLFFDWVGILTGTLGMHAALIYALLSIAAMAETESVRWFGYVLAALSGWAILMLGLLGGVSDGMLIVRTLRAEEPKQQEPSQTRAS
jgi:hypothetical protein